MIVERDVVYGDAGQRPLKLHIVRPKQERDAPRPVIVFVHGGGWRGGNGATGIRRLTGFARSGDYFCATIDYRLSGEAIWPAQIHDCKAAIRWLKANAKKYNIDPNRIGVWGVSAGGHLVNMLGTSGDVKELAGNCGSPDQSDRVACVVPFCGPTDLRVADYEYKGSAVTLLLGGPVSEKREAAKQASPVTYVTKDDPPFLIVHGTKDHLVPFAQVESLHAALQKAGVDSTLITVEGGPHGISGAPGVGQRVQDFFGKHLLGKDVKFSDESVKPRNVHRGEGE